MKKGIQRRAEGVFVIEGFKMFMEVLNQFPDNIEEVFLTETARNQLDYELGPIMNSVKYELVEDKLFEKVSETVTPQGVLAIVKTPVYQLDRITAKENCRLLILDSLRDPGNLGTIIRTAEAAGMDAVILSYDCVDVTNPKVVRSTMGAIFRVPFIVTTNLPEMLNRLRKESHFRIYATALTASVPYTEPKYYGRLGIVIGNEANGVSEEVINASDQAIRIPMAGKVESLNAAIAAAIVMYEAAKFS